VTFTFGEEKKKAVKNILLIIGERGGKKNVVSRELKLEVVVYSGENEVGERILPQAARARPTFRSSCDSR